MFERIAKIYFAKKNYKETESYCKKSNTAESNFCLGMMHENGLGCASNEQEALKYYQRSINMGHMNAQVAYERLTSKIAAEKAGIIKPGGAVAMYQPDEDSGVAALIAGVCRERGASLRIAEFDELEMRSDDLDGQEFCYCDDTPLRLPLLGDHQLKNAAVVLEAVEILREKGFQKLSAEAVEQGLAETKWPARFALVHRSPFVIVDGGHNPECGESVAVNMDYYFEESKKVFLVGMLADKDVEGFLAEIAPVADAFVCVSPNSPRALPAAALAEKLKQYQKPTLVCESIAEGVKTAVAAAGKRGAVCATGSLYLVGDVRAQFGLDGVETEGVKR